MPADGKCSWRRNTSTLAVQLARMNVRTMIDKQRKHGDPERESRPMNLREPEARSRRRLDCFQASKMLEGT